MNKGLWESVQGLPFAFLSPMCLAVDWLVQDLLAWASEARVEQSPLLLGDERVEWVRNNTFAWSHWNMGVFVTAA